MKERLRQVLSVSRRSDIPAFYMPWFMQGVAKGRIDVVNPFNHQVRQVAVSPERVHTMVFWSKNFIPFLDARCGERLQAMGYHLFFNFTINSHAPDLEPGVPPLSQRLDQLRTLAERFGSDTIQWRFDPICHYRTAAGAEMTNRGDFLQIATAAADAGIRLCITSFMDPYRKIARRAQHRLTFVDPPPARKAEILLEMEQALVPMDIQLNVCCEAEAIAKLPALSCVRAGACISGARIMAVHGGRVSLRRDGGQRKAAGCRCTASVDVGSYSLHPCYHNCLFCYANPACDKRFSQ